MENSLESDYYTSYPKDTEELSTQSMSSNENNDPEIQELDEDKELQKLLQNIKTCENDDTETQELDEDKELQELLQKKARLEEEVAVELERELKQHIEDAGNNINIFETWMKESINESDLYKSFYQNFDSEYRSQLYENICEFFDTSLVSNDVIFYWKYLVIYLLNNNKKYKSLLQDLELDDNIKLEVNKETCETNLCLVKKKYIFQCFIDKIPICYFKENGNDYYIS